MTASNLAIIFAPNLFQEDPNASTATISSSLVLQTKGTKLITIMIEKYQEVFRELFEKIKANKDFIPLAVKESISKNESKHSTTSSNNTNSVDNSGFIILKGFLSKKTKVKSWKRRFIVLTKTHLMVLEDEDTSKKALDFLDLSKSYIENNYEKKDHTFKICLKTDPQSSHLEEAKEIILKAENETEKNQWFNSIQERIDALQTNQAVISIH